MPCLTKVMEKELMTIASIYPSPPSPLPHLARLLFLLIHWNGTPHPPMPPINESITNSHRTHHNRASSVRSPRRDAAKHLPPPQTRPPTHPQLLSLPLPSWPARTTGSSIRPECPTLQTHSLMTLACTISLRIEHSSAARVATYVPNDSWNV